ncbi:hypothetical protein QUF72_08270 [Desulfobacterales bacterium HSG2]|nr:hypothetical protein [Desulfobacterales bacterium HSG2]
MWVRKDFGFSVGHNPFLSTIRVDAAATFDPLNAGYRANPFNPPIRCHIRVKNDNGYQD